jgi:flagellar hook-associated protein 1 FlgK
MSLTAAMNIANSALTASQIGLQVTSQNLANVSTPGYTRQIALMRAIRGQVTDPFMIGSGVAVGEVRRQIDQALQSRLWNANSAEFSSAQQANVFSQLEAILNEGTDYDLSSELSSFFNVWSEATTVLDSGSTLVNQGRTIATYIKNMRSDLLAQRRQIEDQIDAQANNADALFEEIASINATISSREVGNAQASALRDRRDQIVTELSQLMEITVSETNQGGYDVYVGSTPIVQGNNSRGISVDRRTINGSLSVRVTVGDNNDTLNVDSGSLGGLLSSRDGAIDETLEKLDRIAANLIFEVNKLHSTGVNESWLQNTLGTLQIESTNQSLPLNDPDNFDLASLPFAPVNGGFVVHVRNEDTGTSNEVFIPVDLDGIDTTGALSTADDTSAEDIRAALDAIDGISATFDPSGRLSIDADLGFSFAFADDTSGVLATLGVNTFFEGTSAADIGVIDDIEPNLGRVSSGGEFNANGTASLIAQVADSTVSALGDKSITKFWAVQTQNIAVLAGSAITKADADAIVRQSLDAQRASVSGVSVDEESINLISYQNQYQGAARVITAAQEMFDTLLSLV